MSMLRRNRWLCITLAMTAVCRAPAHQVPAPPPTLQDLQHQGEAVRNQAELDHRFFQIQINRLARATFSGTKGGVLVQEEGKIGQGMRPP